MPNKQVDCTGSPYVCSASDNFSRSLATCKLTTVIDVELFGWLTDLWLATTKIFARTRNGLRLTCKRPGTFLRPQSFRLFGRQNVCTFSHSQQFLRWASFLSASKDTRSSSASAMDNFPLLQQLQVVYHCFVDHSSMMQWMQSSK